MTKEKMKSLKKYVAALKNRKLDKLPEKHAARSKTFFAFLDREIEMTEKKIKEAEMEMGPQK